MNCPHCGKPGRGTCCNPQIIPRGDDPLSEKERGLVARFRATRLEPVRDRHCSPNKNCRYARPGPGERCLDCGELEPSSRTNCPPDGVCPEGERLGTRHQLGALAGRCSACSDHVHEGEGPRIVTTLWSYLRVCTEGHLLSACTCAELATAELATDRQRALELTWKLRELVHAIATCEHKLTRIGERNYCGRCGSKFELEVRPPNATPVWVWRMPELVDAAKALDGEMNSDATTVHEPESDSGEKKRS